MEKIVLYIVVIFTISSLVGCKKPSDRKCLKSSGTTTTRILNESQFIQPNIMVSDNIHLELINDSLNYIELKGAENLLNFIDVKIVSDTLKISDLNQCSFVRKHKDEFSIVYHYTDISSVFLLGYGALTNKDTLKHNVLVIANNSFSTIDLTVDNDDTHISIPLGNVPVNLTGKTKNLFVYSSGHSAVRAENLFATKAHGHSRGIADFHIRASEFVNVELYLKGNFYIYGNPIDKKYSVEGTGQIFEVN
jgi:hypothetical protein